MRRNRKKDYVFLGFFVIPVIWGALLFAPYMRKRLFFALPNLDSAVSNPFHIVWVSDVPRTTLISVLAYLIDIGTYISGIKNYRRKGEYGSAKWGDNFKTNKKYMPTKFLENKLLTQSVRIGLDGRKRRKNLDTIVLDGSSAGETRFYIKPNILQYNTSFVILDPKGEILRDTDYLLEKEGYVVKVIDLTNMSKSHCYNPFTYIKDDKDVLKLITNLIRNVTPKGSQTNDPFWEELETALLEALCLYLIHETPEEEQNFTIVMEMITSADIKGDDGEYQSPLDELFDRLEMRKPDSLTLKQYKIYKQTAGVICSKRLLDQAVGKSPRTRNLRSKKGT